MCVCECVRACVYVCILTKKAPIPADQSVSFAHHVEPYQLFDGYWIVRPCVHACVRVRVCMTLEDVCMTLEDACLTLEDACLTLEDACLTLEDACLTLEGDGRRVGQDGDACARLQIRTCEERNGGALRAA